MIRRVAGDRALESLLATTLQRGTWVAGGVIAIGLIMPLLGGGGAHLMPGSGDRMVAAGIALLILLPVVRVALMLIAFIRERDFRFAAIAGLVLLIIVTGLIVGTHGATFE